MDLVLKVEKEIVRQEDLGKPPVEFSKGHKWIYFMLISPELGYKYVELEKPILND